MNIVFFVPIIDQIGGAEIGTRRLAERIAQRGHQVTILSTQALSEWRQNHTLIDYTKNVRVVRLPVWQRSRHVFTRMLALQAIWAFPLLLRKTQIIHLRGLTPKSMVLAQIGKRLGISTLCVPTASGIYGDVATFPAKAVLNTAVFDWISSLTEPMQAEATSWGFPLHKTGVIPNGIDINKFKPSASLNESMSAIYVGQFRPEKRIDLLLQAWIQVQTEYPKAQLWMVGGGQFTEKYKQMSAQMNISPTFIPNVDVSGVITNLRMSSTFIMPGISEGMSNALLEAMGVGLAPIVADTPANRAVITPEIDGFSYNPASPEALAAQIKRLISDVDLAAAYRRRCAQHHYRTLQS